MAETKNLGGLADAIFAEIDRLQDPELTGDRLKEEITRAQSISGLARQASQIASLQISVSKMVCEAPTFPSQRRCRSCIDSEQSFRRSQSGCDRDEKRKEHPNG